MLSNNDIEIMEIQPIKDTIIGYEVEHGEERLVSGIIKLCDVGKDEGIRPRRFTIYAVGPDVDWLQKGDRVLVKHGRWSRGHDVVVAGEKLKLHKLDPNDIELVFIEE